MPAKDRRGDLNGNCKLTTDQIHELRKIRGDAKRVPRDDPRSYESLSKRFGITKSQCGKIINMRLWKHIGSPVKAVIEAPT